MPRRCDWRVLRQVPPVYTLQAKGALAGTRGPARLYASCSELRSAKRQEMRYTLRSSIVAGLVLAGLSLPTPAHADAWVSGFVGTLFGGTTGTELSEAVANGSDTTYGFSVGSMGNGVLGAEFDLGHTPRFFGEDSSVETSSLTTAQGSLILGIPIGGQTGPGIRPYGVFGVGMIRRVAEFRSFLDDISTSDFGYNVGFGVMGFISDVFGIRADYRYFRNFQKDDERTFPIDLGTFDFSRATVGVVLRF